MTIDNFLFPNEKLLFLVFLIGNKRYYDTVEITEMMDCSKRTALRYIQRLKDIQTFIPNIEIKEIKGHQKVPSKFKITYK
jgi:Fic family protein